MKKFVFTLESLKRYQDQVLETEKGKLSELRGELNRLEAELEDILAELERLNGELVVMYEKGTTPLEISVHKRYISAKQQELHIKRHQILMKGREIEAQLQVVVDATREVSKLEKLEEHQIEEYKALEQKENELFIEEFVSNSDWRKANSEKK